MNKIIIYVMIFVVGKCFSDVNYMGRFTIESSNPNVIIDKKLNLMWLRDQVVLSGSHHWNDYYDYISSGYTDAGYSDWRLPTIGEMVSIADYSKIYPAINNNNPLINVVGTNSQFYLVSDRFVYDNREWGIASSSFAVYVYPTNSEFNCLVVRDMLSETASGDTAAIWIIKILCWVFGAIAGLSFIYQVKIR